jgi:transketolase
VAEDLEQRAINVIRGIAMDAPRQANSGHPGTAMALAPLAQVLFTRVMRHDPANPDWPDRDRFVLSAGHASILLYSSLYLSGYGLTLDDLRDFRQWDSRTPGHPEVHHTAGVEVTTGPLGQGLGNAVGMALAERLLRARFGPDVCDHRTFAIASDGDMQEGISHEAASLAGHLGLGRLVVVYDDNHISIDGPTELSFSDDTAARFRAYGWRVDELGEVANDLDALEAALRRAVDDDTRPSLLVLRSHIGYPSPTVMDTAKAHGDPMSADDIAETKRLLGLPEDETFWVPDDVLAFWRDTTARRGAEVRGAWHERLAKWAGDRAEWDACLQGSGLPGWEQKLPTWNVGDSLATRVASGECLNALIDLVPGLAAGGADLTNNTGTLLTGETFGGVQSRDNPGGRLIHYGIREHGMAAAMNGMALHGGVVPVGGTFLIFSDYMRPAVRLAAMSEAKVVYSFTHDSVGLGEDGPTHQPVEHAMSLRLIPGLRVVRPADANETAAAWRVAISHSGPTALLLTRQKVPVLAGTLGARVDRGAYVLIEPDDVPDLCLLATGSEVHLCVEAATRLESEHGLKGRVVSFPCADLFVQQDDAYQLSVLAPEIPTLAVEAGASLGWTRWADASISLDRFGASAPGEVALAKLGFNVDNVVDHALALVGR